MGRRTILLTVAAVIAALGATMVFLYVRGADARAQEGQAARQVLKAVAQIAPGESLAQAQAAGKLELGTAPQSQLLEGAVDSTAGMEDEVALQTIYPNEQIVTTKFGSLGEQSALTIPDGDIAISVNLSDTGRVAGFISPGSKVAVFLNNADGSRLLLPEVLVIAVGDTTVVSSTTTTSGGAQTTEQFPRTLFTLAVNQQQAQKLQFGATIGELAFGLLNENSKVFPGPGTNQQNLFG